jgi:CDP-diacylglycerol--glycerol-3-phosphate 3-phosphatidyltransferase
MTIYDLKPRFQALLRPLTDLLYRSGATANIVTVAAMLASIAYGAWMLLAPSNRWAYLLLPAFLLVRMALNAIDGMLARQYRQQSDLGAILNELGDVVSDAALYVPFALLPGVSAPLVLVVVFLSVLTEFTGVLGQLTGAGRRYDGPLGKSDRAFAFGVLGLLVGTGIPVLRYLDPAMLLMTALLGWTVLNRARHAIRPPLDRN